MAGVSSNDLHDALRTLAEGRGLSEDGACAAFRELMSGRASPILSAALLFGLRARGEQVSEIAGAARALRESMVRVHARRPDSLVDTCGTGGGILSTLNVSTGAAFIVAGAGVTVAKHGNRSYTSKSGSADVLEALGVDIDLDADAAAQQLHDDGLAFLFAPNFHPAMRHVAPTRRELALPTIMNLLGPLVNPAGAGRQVIGVADAARAPLLAGAMARLGTVRTAVVHARAGMDEVSPAGITDVWEVRGGAVRQWEFDPGRIGVAVTSLDSLAGGEPAANAARIEAVLRDAGAAADAAALLVNATLGIYVSRDGGTLEEAAQSARESVSSGHAFAKLERLRNRGAVLRRTSG